MKKTLTIEIDTEKDSGMFEENELNMMLQSKSAFGALFDLTSISKHTTEIQEAINEDLKYYENVSPEVLEFLKDGSASDLIRDMIRQFAYKAIENNKVDMELYN